MKRLIFMAVIALAACSKTETTPTQTTNNNLYYRIKEVDKDGTSSTTSIKYINLMNDNAVEGDGDHHDGSNHDSTNCPLAIDISTFTLSKYSSNAVKINFSSTNEGNVDHYEIEKSTDSKQWGTEVTLYVISEGNYSYIDKF
jgi:hypothetical protein